MKENGIPVGGTLPHFSIGTDSISSWFDTTGSGVTTPPTIESDNAGLISFMAIENNVGIFVAVIYDAAASASPNGSKGGATVQVTCNGGACSTSDFAVAVDTGIVSGGSPATLAWQPCCEDGFVLGPFSSGQVGEVCFTHSNLSGISGARFVDGSNVDYLLSLGSVICISF